MRPRRLDAWRENLTGCLLAAGAFITVTALGLAWVFGMAGVYRGTYTREAFTNKITDAGTANLLPLMITIICLGITMMLVAVAYGIWRGQTQNQGLRRTVENVRVLSRYGFSRDGNMLNADWELEAAENPRYYLKVQFADGTIGELECAAETFFAAGEGMYGDVELQGLWVGLFTPYIGVRVQL